MSSFGNSVVRCSRWIVRVGLGQVRVFDHVPTWTSANKRSSGLMEMSEGSHERQGCAYRTLSRAVSDSDRLMTISENNGGVSPPLAYKYAASICISLKYRDRHQM